jgi:alpha-1,6-mannosyltransferase
VPRSAAGAGADPLVAHEPRPRPHLRLVATPRLCVVDVALFYGERSGGIRTYLDAKVAWSKRSGAIDHHLVIPGEHERHVGTRHELAGVPVSPSNGYRIPPGYRSLHRTLMAIKPDVVMLHDPYWGGGAARWIGRELGAATVSVHHSSVALGAAGLPGPEPMWKPVLRWAHRRAYRSVDAVMSVVDTRSDGRRAATLKLRLGLDPAFRPFPRAGRGDHVLYAGRLGREKGVFELLQAAALSEDPWPLHLAGSGPAEPIARRMVARLRLEQRVSFRPFLTDRDKLAQSYAAARCVVVPGAHETFGLALLEAAACGARVVASDTCPAAHEVAPVASIFRAGDPRDLLRAIERARLRLPDPRAAREIADRHRWDRSFEAELADLERLVAA